MGYSIMQTNHRLMSYLNSVSTGVILAAAFTHLLPDAVSDLKQYTYPVAEACSLTGFLLLVLVETSMQYVQYEEDHEAVKTEHLAHNCADHEYAKGVESIHEQRLRASSMALIQAGVNAQRAAADDCRVCEETGVRLDPHDHLFGKEVPVVQYGSFSHPAHSHDHNHGDEHRPLKQPSPRMQSAHSHGGHTHADIGRPGLKITLTGAYTLWAALMVHSTLEGFGVGVTSSVQQGAIVFAILIHKGFESLALNAALLEGGVPYPVYLLLYGSFCLSIPVGAMAGALLKSNGNSAFSGIITGLASGSFMYIGTMEMLPTTLHSCENMVLAISLFIGSAAAMAALAGLV